MPAHLVLDRGVPAMHTGEEEHNNAGKEKTTAKVASGTSKAPVLTLSLAGRSAWNKGP